MGNIFTSEEDSNTNKTSIDSFFFVLNDLFKQLDLISDSPTNFSDNKFLFIEAYPDQIYEQNNIITYDVALRRPFKNESKATSGPKTTQIRPYLNGSKYDIVSGNVKDYYTSKYENIIVLDCFSTSARVCKLQARLLESLFITHLSVLKKHVRELIHIETGKAELIGQYDGKRLFSKKLAYRVITEEQFSIDLEQLKNISLDIEELRK